MRAVITEENPILMGLSFGGMLCTEIAKQIPVNKIIIISSIKSSKELPFWMRTVASLKLHKIVPLKSTRLTEPIQNKMLGVQSEDEKIMAANYRRSVGLPYTNWAVNQALNWKNDWQHPHTYHIHGDKDNMFPIKNIKADHIIKNGGHFMVMNHASEVSDCINAILAET
jgi:pimeloyl-ACP methyl ester carboxylesterase